MDQLSVFNELLEKHGTLINKVCYFYATCVDDFKDLRQEGLLNLWRSIGKFRGECAPATWIYRIILNSCVSYRRMHKHHNSEPIENHPELIADNTDKAELTKELYSLINQLDRIEKALILMWLDGMDYESIATVAGMNRTTVGTRIHRIKAKLVELSKR